MAENSLGVIWRNLIAAGLAVPINRTFRFGPHTLEVVGTVADLNETSIAVRTRAPRIHLRPIAPPEIEGSAHGEGDGEIFVWRLLAVEPQRKSITLAAISLEDALEEVGRFDLPVDRSRTSEFERRLERPIGSVGSDGISVSVSSCSVGALRSVVRGEFQSRDQSIEALYFGWPRMSVHHIRRGPTTDVLWNDWRPRASDVDKTTRTTKGGITTVQISSSLGGITGKARRRPQRTDSVERATSQSERVERATPLSFREAVTGVALPSGEPLKIQGRVPNGSPLVNIADGEFELDVASPPPESTGLEMQLALLYAIRFAPGEIELVPAPIADEAVDLGGRAIGTSLVEFDLLRWEPSHDGGHRLVVQSSAPDAWPDLRILHGEASASLWAHHNYDGTIGLGLPRIYDAAFEDLRGVRLALRAFGLPIAPLDLTLSLTR